MAENRYDVITLPRIIPFW